MYHLSKGEHSGLQEMEGFGDACLHNFFLECPGWYSRSVICHAANLWTGGGGGCGRWLSKLCCSQVRGVQVRFLSASAAKFLIPSLIFLYLFLTWWFSKHFHLSHRVLFLGRQDKYDFLFIWKETEVKYFVQSHTSNNGTQIRGLRYPHVSLHLWGPIVGDWIIYCQPISVLKVSKLSNTVFIL